MPIVKLTKPGDDEGEALGRGTGAIGSGELSRVTQNLTLADHVGRFIAGEITSQYKNENIADLVKGKNMWMISGSWG